MIFQKFLRAYSRTNYGELLGPIIATKNSYDFRSLVVDRATRIAVASFNFGEGVLVAAYFIWTIKHASPHHLISMRPRYYQQLFVFNKALLKGRSFCPSL